MLKYLICIFITGHNFDKDDNMILTDEEGGYTNLSWCKRCNKYRKLR